MATLPTLAFGTGSNFSSTAETGTPPVLEVIGSADMADWVADTNNSSHTGTADYALDNMPGDFGSMLTLNVNVRYGWQTGTQTNTWSSLDVRIFQSDGTTPLTDSRTIASSITTNDSTSGALAFTGVDTSSDSTVWDGAIARISFVISKNKGGDSLEERVFAAELTGTYTVASSPVNVTPGTASLSTSTFAPTVATPVAVTPAAASLTTSLFAPTVFASDNQEVTPSNAALTTSLFAPTVSLSDNQNVTPGVAALTTSLLTPTVTTTDHQNVTPGTASLTLATFAPTVELGGNQEVIPGNAALSTSLFAPTVVASNHQNVTPSVSSLTISLFAPTVTTTNHQNVTPSTAALTTALFAPTVSTSGPVNVTPGVASLSLTGYAPLVDIVAVAARLFYVGGDDVPRKKTRKRTQEYEEVLYGIDATLREITDSRRDIPKISVIPAQETEASPAKQSLALEQALEKLAQITAPKRALQAKIDAVTHEIIAHQQRLREEAWQQMIEEEEADWLVLM